MVLPSYQLLLVDILPTKNVNAASFHIVNRNESLLMQLDFEVRIGFLFHDNSGM